MENVDPVNQQHFLCSFLSAAEAIANGLSYLRFASANIYWTTWYAFYAYVALYPLLLPKKESIPIITTFATKYRHGNISTSGKKFCSHIVEDVVHSIG